MSVKKIQEQPYDREKEGELYGDVASEFKRTYIRRFFILVDNIMDTIQSIEADALYIATIPDYLDTYPTDTSAIVVRITLKNNEESPFLWVCHVNYGYNYDMTLEPADISIGFRKYTKPFDKANNTLESDPTYNQFVIPVVNSAGDPFDPSLEDEVSDASYKISRYETYGITTENRIKDYQDSVNKLAFRDWPPFTGKLNIGAERVLVNGTYYYKTTYDIEMKRDTWIKVVMNRGYRKCPGGKPNPSVMIVDMRGMARTASPVPLKSNGDVITTAADISYSFYLTKLIQDWTPLNLEAAF